ncbi:MULTISPECIES: hypothetical protein [Sorangium]|uniref:Uncharacterized protein n=1 Tax=Sorangium cellulosum TaxID=56 RepID=A0A4P2QFW2_SORCE|nr:MULTISPECIES: hypothetical protein [Sorangium]AUX28725.1 hypothetical protein SOCE836_008060 [Sorangium cellulosum]WCQ88122.1 hypothetical protein NQZ70_00794 [Sorangium sp. Soce836]
MQSNVKLARFHARLAVAAAASLGTLATSDLARGAPSYTLFESGQVRPLAMSPDGKLLLALNTPDGRLEVFRANQGGLSHRASIPVGVEPVAVAARTNDEVWVVNHLSDSVSVVELDPGGTGGRVVRTLLVGDEPRDIVFAGPGRRRAFITTAHRGQNVPFDPQFTTPGIGRADVWVFDANHLGASLGGDPLTIVTLFTDTPRALAVTPDGKRVYAAGFHSGNRTTTVNEQVIPDGFGPGGTLGPATNAQGFQAPEVSLIVQHDGAHWKDEAGRDWDHVIKLSLPDKDVFAIDAMASPPRQVSGPAGFFTGVGTILFNMAVNPVNGKIYVSNTEALNLQRFEGPGIFAGSSLRGHLHESRITVLGGGSVAPRHLNKHIDYASCCAPAPNAESAKSLAQPTGMAVSPDGETLYVAALGSSKVGVFSTEELEGDTFVPDPKSHIPVTGGGPTGLVLDPARRQLYVMTRFDNGISIVDTRKRKEVAHVTMFTPEPPAIVNGRRFLYDAAFSSSHGDSSCASCHIFGDFDSLAWDLGNPDAPVEPNPGPFGNITNLFTGEPMPTEFHPMKGPMTTQSLRGMANHGPMHWRGDRTGGTPDAPSAQPDTGTFDERAAFKKFRPSFTDLLGRHELIPEADMEAFTDFILKVTYPPNPVRNLDNSLTPAQQQAEDFFNNVVVDITERCGDCHAVDPAANPESDAPGFFGTTAFTTFEFQPMVLKIPHLRNAYQKVGMFGAELPLSNTFDDFPFMGDQVRGFGYIHDGTFDTIFRFLRVSDFSDQFVTPFAENPTGIPVTPQGDALRRGLESLILAFPTNMAPIVGQQITLTRHNAHTAAPRIHLLRARADAGECDLVARTSLLGRSLGYHYLGGGYFSANRSAAPPLSEPLLRYLAVVTGRELTYTCVPPGSGERAGIDRDLDGFLDGDEEDAGSDPADPSDTP